MLPSILLFHYGSFLYDFVLQFPFLIFPNRSLTTNATAYNRLLLQSVILEVLMLLLLTFLVSVCTILLSHCLRDDNASLVLLFSTSLILNIIACCSSVRFLSCKSSPSFVRSDSASFMLSSLHSVPLVSPLYLPAQSYSNLHKCFVIAFCSKQFNVRRVQLLFGLLVPLL